MVINVIYQSDINNSKKKSLAPNQSKPTKKDHNKTLEKNKKYLINIGFELWQLLQLQIQIQVHIHFLNRY